MSNLSSEQWSNAHIAANDLLTELLSQMRDLGYNPSLHISYDRMNHHVVLDEELVSKHETLAQIFNKYLEACNMRTEALTDIQAAPKLDIGFGN